MSTEQIEVRLNGRWTLYEGMWAVRLTEYDEEDKLVDLRWEDGYAFPDNPQGKMESGKPVRVYAKSGKTTVRYLNRQIDDFLYTVVDSPDDAKCTKQGKHADIKDDNYIGEEGIQFYGVRCDYCGARETFSSYDPVEHAEAAYEFEDWADHHELGEHTYNTPKSMWE